MKSHFPHVLRCAGLGTDADRPVMRLKPVFLGVDGRQRSRGRSRFSLLDRHGNRLLGWGWLLACCVVAGLAWGQETAVPVEPIDDQEPLVVLKQHVPHTSLTDYIKGFLPMSRAEFEAKLKRIAAAAEVSEQVRPSLGRGLYYARFESDQLVEGRAALEVRHTEQGPGVLNFERVGLAARKFRWKNSAAAVPQLGLNAAGQFVVLVNRSDDLLFSWSLRPVNPPDQITPLGRSPANLAVPVTEFDATWQFSADLPAAASQQWVLDLPSGWVPQLATGTAEPFSALTKERVMAMEQVFGSLLPTSSVPIGLENATGSAAAQTIGPAPAGASNNAPSNPAQPANANPAAQAATGQAGLVGPSPGGQPGQVAQPSQAGLAGQSSQRSPTDPASQPTPNQPGSAAVQAGQTSNLPPTMALEANFGSAIAGTEGTEGYQRWLLELGAEVPLQLRLIPPQVAQPEPLGPRLRQTTDYRLSQAGVELRATCTLDLVSRPLKKLEFRADPAMQIVGVQVADEPLPLSMISRGATAEQWIMEFEPPLQPGMRTIVIEALAPLTVREEVRLPCIDLADTEWEQGLFSLQVDNSLELIKLVAVGCVQTKLRASEESRAAEIREFQAYTPAARLLATLELPQPRAGIAVGNHIRLNESTLTARITADLAALRGELFVLDAQVLAPWIIDSVVSVPESALDPNTARTTANRNLRFRFPHAIQLDQPVRLIVHAHRRAPPPGATLRAADFRVLEFATSNETRRLEQPGAEVLQGDVKRVVCLQAEAASRVKTAGRAGIFKKFDELPGEQQALLKPFTGGIVYRDEHPADAFAIELTQERPQYAVKIVSEALVEGRTLRLSHQIRCEPQIASVASLFVQLGQPTTEPLVWSVDGEPDEVLSARRVENAPNSSGQPGEVWQIALRRPRGQAFELAAVSTAEFTGNTSIGLVSVPDAASQTGRLVVGTTDATPLLVDDTGLRAEATPLPQPGQMTWVRGAYRYAPTRDQVVRLATVRQTKPLPDAWIWSTRLESRFEVSGNVRHEVTLAMQNSGLRQFVVRLPTAATLTRVRVDGVELGAARVADTTQRVLIPLPRQTRLPIVQLTYVTVGPPLRTWSHVSPPWPSFDLPSLDQTWKVWLPPGYEAVRNSRLITPEGQPWSIEERLFGTTILRRDERPFDLFAAADWQRLFAPRSQPEQADALSAVQLAQQRLELLLKSWQEGSSASALTWGQWLAAYEQESNSIHSLADKPQLWLDLEALGNRALRPDSPIDLTQLQQLALPSPAATPSASNQRIANSTAAEAVDAANLNLPALRADAEQSVGDGNLAKPHPTTASNRLVTQLLKQYQLRLEATVDGILLTAFSPRDTETSWKTDSTLEPATDALPDPRDFVHATASSNAAQAANPTGEEVVTSAVLSSLSGDRCRVGDWLAGSTSTPEYAELALSLPRGTLSSDMAAGWNSYLLRADANKQEPLGIYRPDLMRVAGWAAFCIVASLAIWLGRNRRLLFILAGLLAALLLLITPELIPLLRGIWCGLLVGLVYRTREPRRRKQMESSEKSFSIGLPASAVSVLVLLVLAIGATSWIGAQEAPSRPLPPTANSLRPRMFPVIVPVDEQRQPWGETVHVPEILWKTLQSRTETLDVAPLDWLLRSANYQVTIEPREMSEGLAVEKVTMIFELETFRPHLQVRLPFQRTEVRSASNIRLNQEEVPLEWDAASDQLSFRVARPDRYYLEFSLVPIQQNDAETRGFQLQIPRLVTSRLKVNCPRSEELQLPTVVGAVERDQELHLIEAELGPTDQLTIRWPREEMDPGEKSELFVKPCHWLQIRPTSLTLTTRLHYTVLSGVVSEAVIQIDPRLRLSRLEGATGQVIEGTHHHALVAQLPEPSNTEFSLEVTFVLSDTGSIGKLLFPQVSPVADATGPASFAVSVAETIHADLHPPEQLQPFSPVEFLDQWGSAPNPPLLAYRAVDEWPPWRIDLRPADSPRTVSQQLIYAVERDLAHVWFQVEIQADTPRFQHRLFFPANVRIQRLELQQDGELVPLRWARAGDELTLFLQRSVAGNSSLRLQGDLPSPRRRYFNLPLVSVLSDDAKPLPETKVELYRRPGVLITELRTDQLQDLPADDKGRLEPQFGRLEARFTGKLPPTSPLPSLQLQISPNVPRVDGAVLQELVRQENRWILQTSCQLQVRAGLVDELRLALPDTSDTELPFQFQPEMPHEVQAGAQGRILLIRPASPVSGPLTFQFRLNLSTSHGPLSNAPLARLLEPNQIPHFLLLPTHSGNEELAWDVRGLRPIELTQLSSALPLTWQPQTGSHVTAYRGTNDAIQIAVRNVARAERTPRIRLADQRITWNGTSTYHGIATFDLEPARLSRCRIEVPEQVELIHLACEGVPIVGQPLENRQYEFRLGFDELPQRIEAVFRGTVSRSATLRRETFQTPLLVGIPVEQTLWTLYGPHHARFDTARIPHPLQSAQELANDRAAATQDLLMLSQEWVPSVDLSHQDSTVSQRWQQRRQQQARLSQLTPTEPATLPINEPSPEITPPVELTSIWYGQTQPATAQTLGFSLPGASERLVLDVEPTTNWPLYPNGLIAVGLIVGLFVSLRLARLSWLREMAGQSPHLIGVLFGLFWWLYATPSPLGLVIAIFFAWGAIRPRWRSRVAP